MSAPSHPIPDSYWAVPGALLAGPRPIGAERGPERGPLSREERRRRLAALLDAGVRTMIDLTTAAEPPSCRVALLRLEPEAIWMRFPILDGDAPSPPLMEAILDAIDASVARGRPVYLHCRGGLGRTGTVVGCHWIRHGRVEASLEAVVAELARLRAGQPSGHRPSPETPAQRRLLASWSRGR